MISKEDLEYFKTNFNIDFTNMPVDQMEKILDDIKDELNKKINQAQKENLELEKEIIAIMQDDKTDK